MTVRATNDKGTGETTRAPVRSSLPEGYRSIPPVVSIQLTDPDYNQSESAHSEVGADSFSIGDLRSTAVALVKP